MIEHAWAGRAEREVKRVGKFDSTCLQCAPLEHLLAELDSHEEMAVQESVLPMTRPMVVTHLHTQMALAHWKHSLRGKTLKKDHHHRKD